MTDTAPPRRAAPGMGRRKGYRLAAWREEPAVLRIASATHWLSETPAALAAARIFDSVSSSRNSTTLAKRYPPQEMNE